jgi:hypothetical protein
MKGNIEGLNPGPLHLNEINHTTDIGLIHILDGLQGLVREAKVLLVTNILDELEDIRLG